jgi:LPS-assembly lipoprotein
MSPTASSISSPRRRLIAVAAAGLLLAGCGFQPLYGDRATDTAGPGGAPAAMAAIEVGVIAERDGQILRGLLIEALNPDGRPVEPAYRLTVTLSVSSGSIGISRDNEVIRAASSGTAAIVLSRLDGPPTLAPGETDPWPFQRRLSATSAYNIQDDEFANLVAEEGAREEVLQQLANDIRTQIALFLRRAP